MIANASRVWEQGVRACRMKITPMYPYLVQSIGQNIDSGRVRFSLFVEALGYGIYGLLVRKGHAA